MRSPVAKPKVSFNNSKVYEAVRKKAFKERTSFSKQVEELCEVGLDCLKEREKKNGR